MGDENMVDVQDVDALRNLLTLHPYSLFLMTFVNPWMLIASNPTTRRQIFMRAARPTVILPAVSTVQGKPK